MERNLEIIDKSAFIALVTWQTVDQDIALLKGVLSKSMQDMTQ